MAFCYQCGEEIEFINNGFGAIPIHPSGSCGGRGGCGYGGAEVTRRFAQQAMEWFLSPVHHISELRQSERTLSSLWRKRLFLSISVWRKSVLRSARTAVAEASMH